MDTTQATFNIGVDTGGTFTDAFVADDAGGSWTAKVPTTPHDLTVCFSDAVEACAQAVGLARHDLLRRTAVIRFSSTIATNTALTRSGPKLGLLVTAAGREALYGLAGTAAGARLAEFIEPDMITGIAEELSPGGEVLLSPSPDEVIAAVRDLLERGARLLVVCLRHSAVNPAHAPLTSPLSSSMLAPVMPASMSSGLSRRSCALSSPASLRLPWRSRVSICRFM